MSEASRHSYLIALGSNMRVPGVGNPRQVIARAFGVLERSGLELLASSGILDSAPVGPSLRQYANAAALVEAELEPPAMLVLLQEIEKQFGRVRRGQRWRSRPLDLDIVLWSGGIWVSPELAIPHPHYRERDFVLRPASAIAPDWRDPVTGLTLRQLSARAA